MFHRIYLKIAVGAGRDVSSLPLQAILHFRGEGFRIGRGLTDELLHQCYQGAGVEDPSPLPCRSTVQVQDPRLTLLLKPGVAFTYASGRGEPFFPAASVGALLRLDDLLHPLYVSHAEPFCRKCGAALEPLDPLQRLRRVEGDRGVLAAVADLVQAPPGLALGALLDMYDLHYLVAAGALIAADDPAAHDRLEQFSEADGPGVIGGVLGTAAFPLQEEARARLAAQITKAFAMGMETVQLLRFDSRQARGVPCGEMSARPRCGRCGAEDSVSLRVHGLGLEQVRMSTVAELHGWVQAVRARGEPGSAEVWTALDGRLGLLRELNVEGCRIDANPSDFSTEAQLCLMLALLLSSELTDTILVFDSVFSVFPRQEGAAYLRLLRRLTAAGNSCFVVDDAEWITGESDYLVDDEAAHVSPGGAGPVRGGAARAVPVLDCAAGVVKALRAAGPALVAVRTGFPAARKRWLQGVLQDAPGKGYRAVEWVSPDQPERLNGPVLAAAAGLADAIAERFAQTLAARMAGLTAADFLAWRSRFRCRRCNGLGIVESRSGAGGAAPVLRCPECAGFRVSDRVLAVRVHAAHISEVLDMRVPQAREHFWDLPRVFEGLELLEEAGFSESRLGDPISRLAPGERERLLLAKRAARGRRVKGGGRLMVFEEFLTGARSEAIERILRLCRTLVVQGDTIICADNHEELLAAADWAIAVA